MCTQYECIVCQTMTNLFDQLNRYELTMWYCFTTLEHNRHMYGYILDGNEASRPFAQDYASPKANAALCYHFSICLENSGSQDGARK